MDAKFVLQTLQGACSNERKALATPFVCDGCICATDGKVAFQCPIEPGYEAEYPAPKSGTPSLSKVFPDQKEYEDSVILGKDRSADFLNLSEKFLQWQTQNEGVRNPRRYEEATCPCCNSRLYIKYDYKAELIDADEDDLDWEKWAYIEIINPSGERWAIAGDRLLQIANICTALGGVNELAFHFKTARIFIRGNGFEGVTMMLGNAIDNDCVKIGSFTIGGEANGQEED